MKTLFTILLLGFSYFVHGQSFYIKVSSGYAFPLGSDNLGEKRSSAYIQETDPESGIYFPALTSKSEVIKGTYGSGVTSSVTFGYMLSENLGLEATASYIHGKKYRSSSIHQDITDDVVMNTSQTTTVDQAKSFIVSPSLRLSAAGDRKLVPFISGGPAISFSSLMRDYEHNSDFEDEQNTQRTEKYSGGISIGFRSALGIELKLTERLSLFSEVTVLVLSYYPREMEVTQYRVNNEDLLRSLNERQQKTVYLKNYQSDTRTDDRPNESPTRALRFSFGMNNIAAMGGLKMLL